MHIRSIITMLVFIIPAFADAQTTEAIAVEGVIHKLFKGMVMGDSAMVGSTFEDATFASIFRDPNNAPVIKRESSAHDFLKAVGTPHSQTWHEEIWDLSIQIDGDFAQAWCNYAFYLDNTFSHCGVDAFHLNKVNGQWKIFQLTDTRRKDPCVIPEAVRKKHQ